MPARGIRPDGLCRSASFLHAGCDVMIHQLDDTVDVVFTTVEDFAQTVLFLSSFLSAALAGQSFLVSHGWFMQ